VYYVCKETSKSGTPHLQGYAELTTQVRFNRIKKKYTAKFILKDYMELRNKLLTIARKLSCSRKTGRGGFKANALIY
jgi:hypothetical protein